MRHNLLLLALLFSGCSGGSTPPPPPPPVQWVCYNCQNLTVNPDGEFAFPNSNGAVGYIYTSVSGNPSGKTISLDYTISGYPPTTFQASLASGSGSPAFRLFMWEKGDNLSCAASYASYRWWAVNGVANLVFGEQRISAIISSDQWTNCLGQQDTAGFNQAVGNLLGIGFTCGAEFYGHGCYATGPATFKINSFTVQ